MHRVVLVAASDADYGAVVDDSVVPMMDLMMMMIVAVNYRYLS
jgi:hypothetical protein